MKRPFLLMMALVTPMTMLFAQNAFLEDGKEWLCHAQNPAIGQTYDFRYYLGGEVERRGHVYRELLVENYGNTGRTERCALLREDEQKVYADYVGRDVLVYDFGMKVGDRIQGYTAHADAGSSNMLEVVSEDVVEVDGVKRRRLGLAECTGASTSSEPTQAGGYWVEGIGSSLSPVCTAGWSPVSTMEVKSCRKDGGEVFAEPDFGTFFEAPHPLETAQPYLPMFTEGKRWEYKTTIRHQEMDGDGATKRSWSEEKITNYVVRGDTAMDGATWKKVYRETEGRTELTGCGMEKDRNVWFYDAHEKRTIHIYDFNLQKYNWLFPDRYGEFLDRVEAVECRGNKLNAYYTTDRLLEPRGVIACVEGVGCKEGLLPYEQNNGGITGGTWEGNIYTSKVLEYVGCFEDGKCVFSLGNFSDLSLTDATDGVKWATMARPQTDAPTYDLQGRRMAEGQALRPGIYVKGGRKFVVK